MEKLLGISVDARKDTYRICRFMRHGQAALDICLMKGKKAQPSITTIELQERIAKRKSSNCQLMLLDVEEDLRVSRREMARLIKRFGSQNIPFLLIQQYKAFFLARTMAKKLTNTAVEFSRRIEVLKTRLLGIAQP